MSKRILVLSIFIIWIWNLQGQSDFSPSNRTPYQTINTHLAYLQPDSYRPALTRICFSPDIDSARAIQYSKQLKLIIDAKGLYVYISKLPNQPNYLDTTTNQNIYILFDQELPQVYVEKVGNSWYYSEETVNAIPDLFKKVYPWGTHHLVSWLPVNSQNRFLGLSVWQYLGIIILVAIAILVYYLLYFIFHAIFNRILKSRLKHWQVDDKRIWMIAKLFSLIVVLKLASTLFPVLQFPIQAGRLIIIGFKIFIGVITMVLLFRIVDLFTNQLNRVVEVTESRMDDQLLPIVNRISKIVIGFLTVIYVLNLLDVNITAILAGVSIGGLALALAAQDTVKNFLGSLMIFIDKPFQIGDFIEVNGQTGTVEEVGFRTTRLRTADTSLIAIPNGSIANISVDNKGVRPSRLFSMTVGVTYNTPLRYIKIFRDGLEEMILRHPKLLNEPRYVRINALDASSINILVRGYIETIAWAEELEVKEQIILFILEFAEELGIQIAFPSQTVYIDQIPGHPPVNNSYPADEETLMNKKDSFMDSRKFEVPPA